MGKVALVFPGQGSQSVGMGLQAFEQVPAARAVFEEGDAVLGESLSTLCFQGPEEKLRLTENTQPAIVATSIALFAAFDVPFDATAGHSLGEYSAHVAAGTITLAEALQLVRKRGRYMQEAVPEGEGAMAAVVKLDAQVVEQLCREIDGVVEPVNYNCPGQTVIAGAAAAVEAASLKVDELGGRAMPLPVSAPFHSSLMKPAEERLARELRSVQLGTPSVPVYVNVDATAVQDGARARDALIAQVSRPVRWEQIVRAMIADGVTLFIEVGPGKTLTGMIRRIDAKVGRLNVQGPDDFEAAKKAISEAR